MHTKLDSTRSLLETTVLATAIAGLSYFVYFQMASWIWSQTVPVNSGEIVPWQVPWLKERDGIELYVLYALMFFNLFSVYAMICAWSRFAGRTIRYFLALPLVAVSCAFIVSIGFHPPMSALGDQAVPDVFARALIIMAVALAIIMPLSYLQKHSTRWALATVALLLVPVCFIATAPLSWYDYQHILAPALRLLHGAGVSEVYFQYDFLLSLIGLAWLELGLDPNQFQIVGQCAYYLLLLGLFGFSGQWFLDKRLPVFLLVALVLVRIYAGQEDAVQLFQITPLRLDLWLILLVLVYFKGPYHWSAGLFCGLMLLLHHNFGIIYSAAYIQLLLTLSVIDRVMISDKAIKTLLSMIYVFLKNNYHNLVLMLVGATAHYLFFRNTNVQSDFSYTHLGINFIRISTNSFYWYVVVVLSLSFALLIRLRSRVSSNYLATGFCLIYLAIGNSLYFFGRSHENNIINISIILLLLFFILLDIVGRSLVNDSGKPAELFMQRNLAIIVSVIFIASITIWYGDSITGKSATQARNAKKQQFIYPSLVSKQSVMSVIADVKSVAGDNPKVYFADHYDFLLDYYGGYAPVGYFSPMETWVSKREFDRFLQGLLNQGYYLVIADDVLNYDDKDALAFLTPFDYKIMGRRLVAWKETAR